MRRPPALVLGVPIADVTNDEAIGLLAELVAEGRAQLRTRQIATVNVDFLVNALADPDIAAILQHADVCLADGMPVVWGARALGMPIRERVAGADLVPALIEASRSRGWHVHVFGSQPDVADAARALLRERYPEARFSIDPGPMIPDPEHVDDEVLDAIAAVDADILCVALGNPKQERFIRAHRERLRTPVMIGVGGSLDMFVGKRRRAPVWAQRLGLEWIVRAAQEPRRLGRRYAHDIRVFGPTFVRARRAGRRRRRGAGLALEVSDAAVAARLDGDGLPEPERWSLAADRIMAGAPLVIDAGAAGVVRDAALAHLVGLVRIAGRSGAGVTWRTDPRPLGPCLAAVGLSPAMLGIPPRWQPDRDP